MLEYVRIIISLILLLLYSWTSCYFADSWWSLVLHRANQRVAVSDSWAELLWRQPLQHLADQRLDTRRHYRYRCDVAQGWTGLLIRPERSETKAKTKTRECKTKTETKTKELLWDRDQKAMRPRLRAVWSTQLHVKVKQIGNSYYIGYLK